MANSVVVNNQEKSVEEIIQVKNNNLVENNSEETPTSINEEKQHIIETTSNVESKQQNIKPALKKPPDILCNCPQKCDQRVPQDIRSSLYEEFCRLGDHVRQNAYLQSFIEMRSVYKRLWCQEERVGGRLQRRVSCKYKVPIEVPKQSMDAAAAEELSSVPKLTTNSKGQATLVVGSRECGDTIEVCQKAFMNVYGITEKRIRLQREKLIARLRGDIPEQRYYRGGSTINNSIRSSTNDDINNYASYYYNNSLIHHSSNHQLNQTSSSSTSSSASFVEGQHDDDELSIVDTFFRNQLWKPEYIGISSDKLQFLDMYYNNVKA